MRKQQELEAVRKRVEKLDAGLSEARQASQTSTSALAEERAKHEAAQQELQERVWEAQEQVW